MRTISAAPGLAPLRPLGGGACASHNDGGLWGAVSLSVSVSSSQADELLLAGNPRSRSERACDLLLFLLEVDIASLVHDAPVEPDPGCWELSEYRGWEWAGEQTQTSASSCECALPDAVQSRGCSAARGQSHELIPEHGAPSRPSDRRQRSPQSHEGSGQGEEWSTPFLVPFSWK